MSTKAAHEKSCDRRDWADETRLEVLALALIESTPGAVAVRDPVSHEVSANVRASGEPAERSADDAAGAERGGGGLTFPMTFPISMGTSGLPQTVSPSGVRSQASVGMPAVQVTSNDAIAGVDDPPVSERQGGEGFFPIPNPTTGSMITLAGDTGDRKVETDGYEEAIVDLAVRVDDLTGETVNRGRLNEGVTDSMLERLGSLTTTVDYLMQRVSDPKLRRRLGEVGRDVKEAETLMRKLPGSRSY